MRVSAGQELISPNLHVILVHFPLALLVAGLAIEIVSLIDRRSTLRTAGRWMVLLGALLAVPTALSGMYAFADVARRSIPAEQRPVRVWDMPWWQVLQRTQLGQSNGAAPAAAHADAWRMLKRHGWVQAPATAFAVVLVVLALSLSARWRRRLYVPLLLGMLGAAGLMVWGAWYGGESVYRHGAAVALGDDQSPPPRPAEPPSRFSLPVSPPSTTAPALLPESAPLPFTPPPAPPPLTAPSTAHPGQATTAPTTEPPGATAPSTAPTMLQPVAPSTAPAEPRDLAAATTHPAPAGRADGSRTGWPHAARSILPPLQVHIIVAGCAVAMALGALGLSIRAASRPARLETEDELELLREQVDEPGRRRATPDDVALLRSFQPQAALIAPADEPEAAPSGRVWLVAFALALLAALIGFAYLASISDALERAPQEHRPFYRVVWEQVTLNPPEGFKGLPADRPARYPSWLTRRLAHVVSGSAIIGMSLLLAVLARWARRQRLLLACCAMVLVGAIAAQVWLGVLMIFDTPAGDVTHFQRPPAPGSVIAEQQ